MFIAMYLNDLARLGLAHFDLSQRPDRVEHLVSFARELERWNRKINLTAIDDAESVIRELLYDAFHLLGKIGDTQRLLDMGSGGGILAVPFAILRDDLEVLSVDSSLKKIQFQRHIKRVLGLRRLIPVQGRIEDLDPLAVDCVVAKAFGPVSDILGKAAPHLSPGGRVLLPRGTGDGEPPHVENFRLLGATPYTLPGVAKRFVMVTYEYEE
jgi:16S rRNA (guanine527-N7)-methyltransferase